MVVELEEYIIKIGRLVEIGLIRSFIFYFKRSFLLGVYFIFENFGS